MPVVSPDGELLGVTQLVNKRKPGDFGDITKKNGRQFPISLRLALTKTTNSRCKSLMSALEWYSNL
jgi:hypothetical protein